MSTPMPEPQAPTPQANPQQSGFSLEQLSAILSSGGFAGMGSAAKEEPLIFLGETTEDIVLRKRGQRIPRNEPVPEEMTLTEWTRRWYQLTAEERADYTERFKQAGYNITNPIQARAAWVDLGQLAAEQYANRTGDTIAPDDLLDTLIAESPAGEEGLSEVEEDDLRAKARTQLERFAYDNGLNLNKETLKRHVDSIVSEETTLASLQKAYMKQLTAAYPAFAEQIEAGFTLREIASPYASEMSRLLEIPEDAIDFRDPAMAKALQAVSPDGKPTYVPLWQFREQLKQDERWQYTDNAWEEMSGKAMEVAKMFGLSA